MPRYRELEVGDIIEIKNDMYIYSNVKERYIYSNRRCSTDMTYSGFTVDKKHFKRFIGIYVVCFVDDEKWVFCTNIKRPNIKVTITQNSNYIGHMENIKSLGKARFVGPLNIKIIK